MEMDTYSLSTQAIVLNKTTLHLRLCYLYRREEREPGNEAAVVQLLWWEQVKGLTARLV